LGECCKIAEIFEVLEVPVFYADAEAKKLLATDPTLQAAVKSAFGWEIFDEEGTLNRQALAQKVFHDQEALSTLNTIIHPAVRKHFDSWKAECSPEQAYIIQEAALLFETGADENFDYMISVTAPEALRIHRIMERDNMSRADVQARMLNQWPQEQKDKQSDFIIHNDGYQWVTPEVLKIHRMLTSEQAQSTVD